MIKRAIPAPLESGADVIVYVYSIAARMGEQMSGPTLNLRLGPIFHPGRSPPYGESATSAPTPSLRIHLLTPE